MRLAPPGLNRCFFADNGSAAIEVALKMSFHYWRNRGAARKTRFITLANSYHGETLGALAVGNIELYSRSIARCSWTSITAPSPDASSASRARARRSMRARMFEPMERASRTPRPRSRAVIVEPLVQCAGGMRMYDPVISNSCARPATGTACI